MRYLFNSANLARGAAVSATHIVPSSAIYRTDTAAKQGGGQVVLSGPYTGQADTQIEVSIANTAGGTLAVSQPVFTGMGNGVLDALSATGLPPQAFEITLENMGVVTTTARAPFQGALLRAAATGAGGNSIAVSVDRSDIVAQTTAYSLQEDLQAGTNEYSGEHWNFGAALLTESGSIPDDAPRLRFGNDPQVYRAWRKYQGDKYVYGFSPAPVRSVPTGSMVYLITGTYAVDVVLGATVEHYAALVSLYDALAAIRDGSTLATVQTPVVESKRPGDMGAVDVSEWTVSYVLGIERDGGRAVQHALLAVSADTAAPTETLTLTCIQSPATGSEVWEVRGDVSGKLPDLTTATAWTHGDYTITVPLPQVPGTDTPTQPVGHFSIGFTPQSPSSTVSVCLDRPTLGAAARDVELTLVWTPKPPEPCDCSTDAISGGPNQDCLGIIPDGGTNMAQQQTMRRLQKLASKVRELVGTNTTTSPASGAYTDEGDVSMILRTAGILSDGLQVLDSATVAWDPWQASTAYTVDQVAEPVTRNGYRYAVSTAGTSGTTEPTWPTTVDTTVADGDVTWACVGKLPYGMWDDAYTQWTVEMGLLSGLYTGNQGGISLSSVVHTWGLATQTSGVDTGAVGVWLVTPAPTNGHVYLLDGGIDSVRGFNPWPAAQPNWSTSGGTVQDDEGSFWADLGPYWESATAVPEGNTAIWFALDNTANPAVIGMTCTTAGTTGTTEPVWPMVAGETVTDGTVVWTSVTISSPTVPVKPGYAPAEQYYARWTSMMDDVGAAAEVIPSNFDSAGTKGDGCWRDWNDNAGWWVFQAPEDDYLPVQNGHYYHASIMGVDETGDPYVHSTQEFGFGLKVGCPELLVPGDTVTIKIHGAATTATGQGYQPGDNFSVRINHALPIAFVGGVTGDDTLTFSVRGSQSGRLDDYPLVTTALAAYSHSGLDFAITPGGIPFALGDSFRFSVESGQFQWRRDGGAWAAAADLADVALADGLTVAFAGGTAPSWVAGDAWTFAAEAVNGPAHLTTPDDTRCAWSEATTLDVTPSTAGPVRGILIAGHAIPANATITITGSDDGFATTPFTAAVPWRSGTIWQALTGGSYAAYRLAISAAGSARWVWLGDPLTLAIRSGNPEFGMLVKRWRLPALGKALGLGGTVTHSALSQTSMDGLLDALAAACTDDAAQFGVVPHDDGADAALVHYAEDSLEVDDEFGHQGDSDTRLLSVSLSMEAA